MSGWPTFSAPGPSRLARKKSGMCSPGVCHLAANGLGGEAYRTSPLDDQWELYDLTADPTEARNRWTDPDLHDLRAYLRMQLKHVRASSVPERNRL